MYKENGRVEPADKQEYADAKSKRLTCSKCGAFGYFRGLTFGEKMKCVVDSCDGIMEEEF